MQCAECKMDLGRQHETDCSIAIQSGRVRLQDCALDDAPSAFKGAGRIHEAKPGDAVFYEAPDLVLTHPETGLISTDQGVIFVNATDRDYAKKLNQIAEQIHVVNKRWWMNPVTGEAIEVNNGEKLMLMVSELAEAMEGDRKNRMDNHLPHRKMLEVELADCMIRIFDFCAARGLDIGNALVEKQAYNVIRQDHKNESRVAEGGKAY